MQLVEPDAVSFTRVANKRCIYVGLLNGEMSAAIMISTSCCRRRGMAAG
jgi:hypothetical protein